MTWNIPKTDHLGSDQASPSGGAFVVKEDILRRIIPVLCALTLAVGLAWCATTEAHSPKSTSPSPSAVAQSVQVTVTGDGVASNVTIVIGQRQKISSNVTLPYSATFKTSQPVQVVAQNGTSDSPITATVLKNGVQVATSTAQGADAVAQAGKLPKSKIGKKTGPKVGSQVSESPSPLPTNQAVKE